MAEIIIVSLVIVTGCRICVSITPDFFVAWEQLAKCILL